MTEPQMRAVAPTEGSRMKKTTIELKFLGVLISIAIGGFTIYVLVFLSKIP